MNIASKIIERISSGHRNYKGGRKVIKEDDVMYAIESRLAHIEEMASEGHTSATIYSCNDYDEAQAVINILSGLGIKTHHYDNKFYQYNIGIRWIINNGVVVLVDW